VAEPLGLRERDVTAGCVAGHDDVLGTAIAVVGVDVDQATGSGRGVAAQALVVGDDVQVLPAVPDAQAWKASCGSSMA